MNGTNIPQNIIKAIIYIIALDDLQLSQGSGGIGHHKWEDWLWTQEDSEYVTSIRNILEPLLVPYQNKKTITTEQRAQVKQAVKSMREYASYDVNGRRLLLKIAALGDNHDWNVANIRFGTPLAKKSGTKKSDVTEMLQPMLSVKKNVYGEMQLSVVSPETPTSKRLPKGMKFVKVFRYIGATAPTSNAAFALYGNAKRGKIHITFEGVDNSGTTKLYAYYFACYESNKGELGQPSIIVSAGIVF